MTIRTRLIILGFCVMAFFIVTPYIVLYSLGYRVNFETWKLQGTGGIYVYAQPDPSLVMIDSEPASENGFFSSAVFVQNLLPGPHNVMIRKDGYHDYQKTLAVKEKEVTKLENVVLFKNNITLTALPDAAQFTGVSQKPASAFVVKNKNLYNAVTNALVLKNVVAWQATENSIYWTDNSGTLYRFNISEETSVPLIEIRGASHLLLSPDNQKIVYWSATQLWYWQIGATENQQVLLQKTSGPITDAYWLNNNYLVFVTANQIIISETDARGNLNTVTLPDAFVTPKIYFNQANKKLYILTGGKLMVSERLLP